MQTLASKHQTIVEMDSLAGIHRVTLFKPSESKYLLARVVMMDDLFYYTYPFRLPDLSKINFSGTNVDYFYNLVKKGQVDWTIFKEVSLSRF